MAQPLPVGPLLHLYLKNCTKQAWFAAGFAPLANNDVVEANMRRLSASSADIWDGQGAHLRSISTLLPNRTQARLPFTHSSTLTSPLTQRPTHSAKYFTRVQLCTHGLISPYVNLRAEGSNYFLVLMPAKRPTANKKYYTENAFLLWMAREVLGKGTGVEIMFYEDGALQTVDCTAEMEEYIDEWGAEDFAEAYDDTTEPPYSIGDHCSGCTHFNKCCKPQEAIEIDNAAREPNSVTPFSVFSVPRLLLKKKIAFWNDGTKYAKELENRPLYEESIPEYDTAALTEFFAGFGDTVFYLDFETVSFAAPQGELQGETPNTAVVVQYSLHKDVRGRNALSENIETPLLHHARSASPADLPDGVSHSEILHLHPEKEDRRVAILKKLLSELGTEGPIVVWHASFEKGVLGRLKQCAPECAAEVDAVIERIVDLEEVVKQGMCRHRGFEGSSSIKKVLPPLCPEMQAGYAEEAAAGGIAKGDAASQFASNISRNRVNFREAVEGTASLLRYCRVDTAAMLAIASAVTREAGI